MIQQLQRYDGLDKPEVQNKIDVINDPFEIIKATYSVWKPVAIKYQDTYSFLEHDLSDQVYEEAAKLLVPHAKAFAGIKQDDLQKIYSYINSNDLIANGLYLSALLNVTEMDEMKGIFQLNFLGYKLSKDKKLIVEKGSDIIELGPYSEGDIINHGTSEMMAFSAQGGKQINFGNINDFSSFSIDGIQINFGKCRNMAGVVYRGNQFNFGEAGIMALNSCGGLQVNYDIIEQNMAEYARNGIQVNLGHIKSIARLEFGMSTGAKAGYQFNFGNVVKSMALRAEGGLQLNMGHADQDLTKNFSLRAMNKAMPLIRTLETNLREIEYLKDLKEKPDEAIAAIDAFDFLKLEGDVMDLVDKISGILK